MSDKVYSFDVFDTCLVRTFARPTDLFYALAEQILATRNQGILERETVVELARRRIKAEQIARQTSAKEDITLEDIYRHYQPDWYEISAKEMMQAELRLESNSVRPIMPIRRKIEQWRKQGYRIIFISDMYLPQQTIWQMLLTHKIAHPNDTLYVSGEIGLTKQSGRLFQHVLHQEGITAKQLWHYGDNPRGDVIVPRRLGINTSFFQQSQLNQYEKLVVQGSQDYPLLFSRLAGISRMIRLENCSTPELLNVINLAANVVAPFLTAFVAWVLHDAQKKGIGRLYFVSRDGQILFKIAQKLSRYMPAPECRYLYGSRQAWLFPSIINCKRENLDWLPLHLKTLKNLLKKLNIDPDEIKDVLEGHNFSQEEMDQPLDSQGIQRFWQVVETSRVSLLVEKRADVARKTVLAYFNQEGLCSSTPWALVDVGWALRGQRAVKQMLKTADYTGKVQGYYLAVSHERKPVAQTGPYYTFLSTAEDYNFDSPGRNLLNNTMLVEHLFVMADHETVVSYKIENDKIYPVLKNSSPDGFQAQFLPVFHQTILHFAKEAATAKILPSLFSEMKQTVLLLVNKFISNPSRKEATIAAQIQTVVDQTHDESQYNRLAKPLGMGDFLNIIRYAVIRHNDNQLNPKYDWFEGSLAVSGWWGKFLFSPLGFAIRFKQNNGRERIYRWWSRMVAKEIL